MYGSDLKIEKVVGGASAKVWTQVDSKKVGTRVVMAGAIARYEGESDVLDLAQVGAVALEELLRAGEESTSVADLDKRIVEVETPVADVTLGLAVVVIENNYLWTSTRGEMEVYLERDRVLAKLCEDNSPGVMGAVISQDLIALTSKAVVSTLGIKKWSEVMREGMAKIEELAVVVHSLPTSEGLAIMMVEVGGAGLKGKRGMLDFHTILSYLKRVAERPIVVRRETKRVNTLLALTLMGLLATGIIVGVARRRAVLAEQAVSKLTESVNQKLKEAEQIVTSDSEQANYLLAQQAKEVEKFVKETKREGDRKDAEKLLEKIKEVESQIYHKKEVEPNTLVELAVLDRDLEMGATAGDSEGGVLIADRKRSQVVGVNLEDRSSWKIEGGPYIDIALSDGELYGLKSDGVYKIARKGQAEQRIIEADEVWNGPKFIGLYGGNVYVLDTNAGEIWKYAKLDNGYGARKRWLAPGIELDLSNVSDMWIDGDVWIVTSTGKLERYSRGAPVEFGMAGLPYAEPKRLSGPTAVVTNETYVYVLEAGAGRVDAFAREDGQFAKQYVSQDFKDGRGLVINGEKMFVVSPSRIEWITL